MVPEALSAFPRFSITWGKKRAYVLCGPNAAKGQTINRITDALGPLQVGRYDKCRHQAPVSSVYELAELVTAADADVLIPLGGGSTSDTAKGVACTLGEARPLEELASRYTPDVVYRENYMKAPKMPIVSIASMFGGAEMAPGFGNKTAEGHKIAFRGRRRHRSSRHPRPHRDNGRRPADPLREHLQRPGPRDRGYVSSPHAHRRSPVLGLDCCSPTTCQGSLRIPATSTSGSSFNGQARWVG